MADRIREVNYYYVKAVDRPGAGAKMFSVFRKERVSFMAVHAFPEGKRVQGYDLTRHIEESLTADKS